MGHAVDMLSVGGSPFKVDFLGELFTADELKRTGILSYIYRPGENDATGAPAHFMSQLDKHGLNYSLSRLYKWFNAVARPIDAAGFGSTYRYPIFYAMYLRDRTAALILTRLVEIPTGGGKTFYADHAHSMISGKDWQSAKKKWLADSTAGWVKGVKPSAA